MRYLLAISFVFAQFGLFAQEKCGVEKFEQLQQELNPRRSKPAQFEKWLAAKQNQATQQQRSQAINHYLIPVVVHVVHLPEDGINQNTNISEAQIKEQIRILNEDFRRLNQSQIDQLPPDFKSRASDTHIEFVLAKQDPEGLPTNGIVRVVASRRTYDMERDLELKSLSHWPPDRYLNVYSAPLTGTLLGYAQLPESDELPGLDDPATEQSDGVVITYRYFGKGGSASSNSLGRTATHEMGHYFGLRHIWGDGGCSVDDYVQDTPAADGAHYTCPSSNNPYLACDGSDAMYQNYMDYTEDPCMALFTTGQTERMHIVLNNSPRRKELNNSPAKNDPQRLANDAGLRSLLVQGSDICSGVISPEIELRNYGSNTVNQVQIEIRLDGQPIQNKSIELTLNYPDIAKLTLDPISNLSPGGHTLTLIITRVNNQSDSRSSNNQITTNFQVPRQAELPYWQAFAQADFADFTVSNPDQLIGWEVVPVERNGTSNNYTPYLNFYDYSTDLAYDYLISPIYDLTDSEVAFANFDLAYAQYSGSQDELNVYVSTDCSGSTESATLVYSKQGASLATAPASGQNFVPTDEAQWRTEFIDLSNFINYPQVQLIFEGVNRYGNNLYLDNIRFSNDNSEVSDIVLLNIIEPSPVQADTSGRVQLAILNTSPQEVTSLQYTLRINNNIVSNYTRTDLSIGPGQTDTIAFNRYPSLLPATTYTFQVSVTNPNGTADLLSYNNDKSREVTVNDERDIIPLRNSFGSSQPSYQTPWASVSDPPQQANWKTLSMVAPGARQDDSSDNYGLEAFFTNQQLGPTAWLASPLLDLTSNLEAGMEFYYSYSAQNATQGSLYVLASTNGGRTYPDTLWRASNQELNTRTTGAGIPRVATDWHKDFISLANYLSQDSLRLAFVAEGNNRAQVYLDEIQFYELNQQPLYALPSPGGMQVFPNPLSRSQQLPLKVVFNFSQRQNLLVQLLDNQGRIIETKYWQNVLNTPMNLEVNNLASGLYLLQVRGNNFSQTKRVVVSP